MSTPAPESQSPASTEPASSRGKSGVILRILIWGAVAVAIVLATIELKARYDFTGTADDWYAAQKTARDAGQEFREADLHVLKRGSPELIDVPHKEALIGVGKRIRYRWNGLLDHYDVLVTFNQDADNPLVMDIEQLDPNVEEKPPGEPLVWHFGGGIEDDSDAAADEDDEPVEAPTPSQSE